jgi:MraZ protein
MFRGQHDQSIDPKGRIILPAKFREVLVSQYDHNLVITKNLDGCLVAYPVAEWVLKEELLKQLPTGRKEVRMLKRFYMAPASECAMDRQGRIVIPPSLKQFAHLEKSIVIAGDIDHFEIWDRDLFYTHMTPDQEIFESEAMQGIRDGLGL